MLDVKVSGTALESFGFVAYNTIEGLGLNSFGFVWPCDGIWAPTEMNITTNWSYFSGDSPTLTTSWTLCSSGISFGPEYCME